MESSSWKADANGGENERQIKGLVAREAGEESHGSEITLTAILGVYERKEKKRKF